MHTLAQPTKPVKAFYAHLYDTHGVLTLLDGKLSFMASDSGELTEIEPEMCAFLMPHGEVGIAETQAVMDRLRGGAARIACTRAQEVR
jgi:hypothetical protein